MKTPEPRTSKGLAPAKGWYETATRLPAPPPAARGLLFRGMSLAARRFGRAQVPDIFAVLHRNPRLFWPWLLFASRLMPGGRLPAQEREMIILRTAWNCRSRYEWGQHVEIALRVGVSDAQIVEVSRGPTAFREPRLRALMQACDELAAASVIGDATWQALAGHYDERLLIEIVILIGHYVMIAGFLNSGGLTLEPPVERVLEEFHQRIGLD